MHTLHPRSPAAPTVPDQDARAAWRRRVASIGSQIQLAFAALWLARGLLATGSPGRLPAIVSALGRLDLTVTAIAATIGILLLWLRARLATPGHLTAGILLIAVPSGLACGLSGSALTAAAGLATGTILVASAVTGFRALASGQLRTTREEPRAEHRT